MLWIIANKFCNSVNSVAPSYLSTNYSTFLHLRNAYIFWTTYHLPPQKQKLHKARNFCTNTSSVQVYDATERIEESSMVWLKGQIISKWFFDVFDFLQKTNKGIRLYYYDTSSRLVFVRFLEENEDTKKPFRNYLTFNVF